MTQYSPDLCESKQHHVFASERSASRPGHTAHFVQSSFDALGVRPCRDHESLHLYRGIEGQKTAAAWTIVGSSFVGTLLEVIL